MKMMKTVAEVCIKANIECFVSLEERMGCGVGACLGCAFRTIMPDGSRGYKRVCVDGPVFNASEVDWSEI
ncbi:Dihydroorotate dehydrogenase B (NAD(+)), electron transfer subunit [bioreactor metagenome]|uniref:Dihydroorotate dehydrogenase B (NAD(+)), electron transfer subunit n=1 Tax=bioreactor metagenome TaxID=1076179 RepID=A0A645GU21_9ZZZZ